MPFNELIAELSKPAAYAHAPAHIDIFQTHASILFFAGDLVYKVKKAVNLGFLDFTTLAARRHFCEEELRLNRRLALSIYLDVVPITRDDAGAIRIRGAGETIEYAVEMRRLPAERMLDRLLESGKAGQTEIQAIAAKLASFHAEAATGAGVDEHGSPEAVAAHLLGNLKELQPFAGVLPDGLVADAPVLSDRWWQHLHRWMSKALSDNSPLLERRIAEHRIRDGHGDLHAGNICMVDGPGGRAEPVIYDCIEFNPAFRCCDVAADLAFLAMDLDRRGRRDLAVQLVGQYSETADDPDLHLLQPLYRCHFALVRAKVSAIRARDPGESDEARERAWLQALGYASLAASYTLTPSLIIMTGLPGTGKSWAAAQIAQPLSALVLRSDEVRKELAGLAPTARPEGEARDRLYSQRMTDQTYDELLGRARRALIAGSSVILDGTFPSPGRRAEAANLAESLNVPWLVVHTTAPMPVIRQRMARREQDLREVSDADFAVYLKARGSFEFPEEIAPGRLVEAAAGDMAELAIPLIIARIIDALLA